MASHIHGQLLHDRFGFQVGRADRDADSHKLSSPILTLCIQQLMAQFSRRLQLPELKKAAAMTLASSLCAP